MLLDSSSVCSADVITGHISLHFHSILLDIEMVSMTTDIFKFIALYYIDQK